MIEADCKFVHEGKTFESGGAYVVGNKALVYVKEKEREVTDWHGNCLGHIVTHKVGARRFTMHTRWRMAYVKVRLDDGGVWWGRYNYDDGSVVKLTRVK